MTSNKPSERAMESARNICSCWFEEADDNLAFEFRTGGMDQSILILSVARALDAALAEGERRERERLNSIPLNWELAHEPDDFSEPSSECSWFVYERLDHGSERNRIASGDTPSNAIRAAHIAAAIRRRGE